MESVPVTEYYDSDDEPVGPLPLAAITPGGSNMIFIIKTNGTIYYLNGTVYYFM